MAEWSNAMVLKTIVGATPPRVRIPISPPLLNKKKRLTIQKEIFGKKGVFLYQGG